MRGHERLIDMRRAGKAPRMVFINDYKCATDWFEIPGDAVTICTDGDAIELLDLRFLVGLTVSVGSTNEKRAKALFDRCKRASASVVAACHVQEKAHPTMQSGWTQVWRKETAVVNHG